MRNVLVVVCFLSAVAAVSPIMTKQRFLNLASTWHDQLDSMTIKDLPMVMTHDSATGYLPGGATHPVNNWGKTQGAAHDHSAKVGFAGQLDCGARAFDLRPKVTDGRLIMHHGPLDVDVLVEDGLKEIIGWVNAHPDEVVYIMLGHMAGDNVHAMFQDVVTRLHLYQTSDCAHLAVGTVGEYKRLSAVAGGGHVIIIPDDCFATNWDASVECWEGTLPFWLDYCWGSNSHKTFDKLWSYMDRVSNNPQGKPLFVTQGHWQYSQHSIECGATRLSSIVYDTIASHINSQVAQRIHGGHWAHLNFVQVDMVCDSGLDILNALRARGLN